MISRPDDPYRDLKRALRLGLLLSLLIHPLLVAVLGAYLFVKHPVTDKEATGRNEIVTITHQRTKAQAVAKVERPKPTVSKRVEQPKAIAAVAPRMKPVERPVLAAPRRAIVVPTYRPLEPKHELAKIVPHAPSQPPARTVAYAPHGGTSRGATIHYTAEQLQAMTSANAAAIAHDRSDDNPLGGTAQSAASAVEAPAHHNINFRATSGGLGSAHGTCDSVTAWEADGWDYHYLVCNVVEPDGSTARKALPWPVRFRPRDDYLSEYYEGPPPSDLAVAGPLPGWRPGAGHEMDEDFLEYARLKGYPL